MKSDVYYLKDDTGLVSHKFVVDDDEFNLIGTCYKCVAWGLNGKPIDYDFVADVYCKWDACTHWNFYGEDYDPEIKESDKDSYYHLCGGHSFMNHIVAMCFVWKLAEQLNSQTKTVKIHNNINYVHGSYYSHDDIKNLIDTVLNDYKIVKG